MRIRKTPAVSVQPVQPADLALLRQAAFFRELSAAQAQRLADAARVEEFAPGAPVLRHGTDCGAVFVVLSGTLRVFLPREPRPLVLNIVGRGEVLGEICAAYGGGHTASIAVIETSRLLRLERVALCALKEESPALRVAWEQLLGQRMHDIHARLSSLASGKVPQRVARLLADLAERYAGEPLCPGASPPAGSVAIPLCLRQGDLASWIKACRYRVNDALGALAAQGLIQQKPPQRYTVLNLAALRLAAS